MSQTILWFLIWGLLIFFMMRFGCGSHVMGHGGHSRHGQGDDRSRAELGGRPAAEAIDPVCGMTIATRDAKTAVYEGQVYYFCSQNCREKFEGSPRSYASAPRESATGHMEGHHHG